MLARRRPVERAPFSLIWSATVFKPAGRGRGGAAIGNGIPAGIVGIRRARCENEEQAHDEITHARPPYYYGLPLRRSGSHHLSATTLCERTVDPNSGQCRDASRSQQWWLPNTGNRRSAGSDAVAAMTAGSAPVRPREWKRADVICIARQRRTSFGSKRRRRIRPITLSGYLHEFGERHGCLRSDRAALNGRRAGRRAWPGAGARLRGCAPGCRSARWW